MKKTNLNKQEIFTTRILILFFTCIGAGILMWLERMANYRMDYIFRHHIGLIMAILSFLALAFFGYALYQWIKRGEEEEAVVSRGFLLYLSVAPLLATLLPALSLLGNHEQLFSMATELMGCAFIAYFLAPLLKRLRSPFAAGICVITDLAMICFIYFFRIYYSGTSFILAGTDLMKLTNWGCLLILALLSVGFYLGWRLLGKKNPAFSAPAYVGAFPFLLSLLGMLTLCIHPLTPLVRTILFWSILGIEFLFGLFFILWKKKK